MLKKLLRKIGYVQEGEYVSLDFFNATKNSYEEKIAKLERDNLALRTEIKGKSEPEQKTVIDVTLGDPTPTDEGERKSYVAQVAGFHKDIMSKKLNHMISVAHNMLDETTNDRDFDLILKGVVFSYRDLLKWGESMVNEQVANQTENTPVSDEVKELQDNLKDN